MCLFSSVPGFLTLTVSPCHWIAFRARQLSMSKVGSVLSFNRTLRRQAVLISVLVCTAHAKICVLATFLSSAGIQHPDSPRWQLISFLLLRRRVFLEVGCMFLSSRCLEFGWMHLRPCLDLEPLDRWTSLLSLLRRLRTIIGTPQ